MKKKPTALITNRPRRQLSSHSGWQLLVYEELASNPLGVARRTLEAAGILWSELAERYVAASRGSDEEDVRGITTVPESRRCFSSWTSQISDEQRGKVEEMTRGSELLAQFDACYPGEGR